MKKKESKEFIITEEQIVFIRKHIPLIEHSKGTIKSYGWHINNTLKKVEERPL
jgi:hypothetical protein